MSILDEIYDEMYAEKRPDTAEYRELKERSYESWEKAAEILGFELSNRVWNDLSLLDLAESRHDFKEGVSFGIQLMLEVLLLPGAPLALKR